MIKTLEGAYAIGASSFTPARITQVYIYVENVRVAELFIIGASAAQFLTLKPVDQKHT